MIFKYNRFFTDLHSINEDVRRSRKFLEDIGIKENNKDYQDIRNMLSDNLGLVFTFVYFRFVEDVPLSELKDVYGIIKEYKNLLTNLPKPVHSFINNDLLKKYIDEHKPKVTKRADKGDGVDLGDLLAGTGITTIDDPLEDTEAPKGDTIKKELDLTPQFEELVDELQKIVNMRSYKKLYNELPSKIKAQIRIDGQKEIDDLTNIAIEFYKMPFELQTNFIKKMGRYTDLYNFKKSLNSYIMGNTNDNLDKYISDIEEVNRKYGVDYGSKIIYLSDDIVITEVGSHNACNILHSNTSWCIASGQSSWDTYAGEDKYAKQYSILNFSLPPSDNMSSIGATINSDGSMRTAHKKNDASISRSGLTGYLSEYGIKFEDYLKPMPPEEVEKRKKRIEANRAIKVPGITVDQITKLLEDGADPNTDNGKPLGNAVDADNKEVVEFLLKNGANSNIGAPISKSKNIDMVKILVKNDADLTRDVFIKFLSKIEDIEYLLDHGMNINFEDGYPLRWAVKKGVYDIVKFLIDNGANVDVNRGIAMKWAVEYIKMGDEDNRMRIFEIILDNIPKNSSGLSGALKWTRLRKEKDLESKIMSKFPDLEV